MSRVIAAYDLDEDYGRLWVNADLKRMPEVVVVANQPMDRAQTVTYVPEPRLLEAMDAAREAERRADVAERVATDRKGLCDSLRETNDDLRRIIGEMRAATLGAGTCKRVMDSIDPFTMWVCDHCGHPLDTSEKLLRWLRTEGGGLDEQAHRMPEVRPRNGLRRARRLSPVGDFRRHREMP